MPYIHPTGVPCMTISEFWAAEAKKVGADAGEVMEDFYSSIAKEEDQARQEMMSDTDGALVKLKEYYNPDYVDDLVWTPTQVIKVIDASVSFGMRNSSCDFTAEVNCSDGLIRRLQYTETQYGGSFYEPPDFDCNCVELA